VYLQRWWVAVFDGLCHYVATHSQVSSPPQQVMAVTIGITGDLLAIIANEGSSFMNSVLISAHMGQSIFLRRQLKQVM